ncbi:MAG: VIT family protein [Acidobacteria bacterium]|nr:VIT family protein [Acidobacteriota bacterium]
MDRDLLEHRLAHHGHQVGGLRAAVLGANDGIVSTSSLIIGVASADGTREAILIAGIAGLIAGALSMAAGEYVSVHSQADTDTADLEAERQFLSTVPDLELRELATIYEDRGLDPDLARTVAQKLTEYDALGAHARDELGISARSAANPLQAAAFSAASFAIGAILPLTAVWITAEPHIPIVAASSLVFLMLLGAIAAKAGGANIVRGAIRVLIWGSLAMAVTALVGRLFGTAV